MKTMLEYFFNLLTVTPERYSIKLEAFADHKLNSCFDELEYEQNTGKRFLSQS